MGACREGGSASVRNTMLHRRIPRLYLEGILYNHVGSKLCVETKIKSLLILQPSQKLKCRSGNGFALLSRLSLRSRSFEALCQQAKAEEGEASSKYSST